MPPAWPRCPYDLVHTSHPALIIMYTRGQPIGLKHMHRLSDATPRHAVPTRHQSGSYVLLAAHVAASLSLHIGRPVLLLQLRGPWHGSYQPYMLRTGQVGRVAWACCMMPY